MKINVLDKPPISGSMAEVQFDAVGNCTWIKFDDGLDEWTGVFGQGGIARHVNAATLFNNDKHAFVIAGGQGYVINLADKSLVYKAPDDYLQDLIAIPSHDLILTCNYTDLILYDSKKKLWESDRLALDGIKFTEASADNVCGYIWQIGGWYSFVFDVTSRSITEQKFMASECDFFEQKPKPKKSVLNKILFSLFRKSF
jgi:hypothetical protein